MCCGCSGKADKVSSATAGDIATLDANGNLVDSGIVASSVIRRVNPSTAVDCNDLTDRFIEYRVGDGDANRPTTGTEAYIIRTFKTGTTSTVYSQIAYQIAGTAIYIRRRFSDGVWSSWEKLVTDSDITPTEITGTGTTGLGFTAKKSGNVVTVYLYCTANVSGGQSISFGTLPTGYRPPRNVKFLIHSNNGSLDSTQGMFADISSYNGGIASYSYVAIASGQCGVVTYIID